MTALVQRAWTFLALGLLFDAFSAQLMYPGHFPPAGPLLRSVAALATLLGDFPAILLFGAVALLIAKVAIVPKVDARVVAACIAIGCVFNALLLRPALIARLHGF